jgi:hypothetical protein
MAYRMQVHKFDHRLKNELLKFETYCFCLKRLKKLLLTFVRTGTLMMYWVQGTWHGCHFSKTGRSIVQLFYSRPESPVA